jgi:integrase/recombinase XerD
MMAEGQGMSEEPKDSSPAARLCLPLHAWPETDRLAWQRACLPGSLLDAVPPAANWAPTTRQSVARSYGRWLTWLGSEGLLDSSLSPAERITRENVNAYLAELRASGCASSTIHMRILHLCRVIDVIAPGDRPDWLGRLLARLKNAIRPARDDRARLVPVETLTELGRSLIRRAETDAKLSSRLRAVAYRDGLMIRILCACPLRAGNLALLRLGSTLVKRGEVWWVVFEAHETKNRKPIYQPLPVEFSEFLERFVEVWRPVLCRSPNEIRAGKTVDPVLLWRGRYGGVFTAKKIGQRISEITHRHLGHPMNPHLFRKLPPTELAIHDPEHVGLSQALLTHATYDTTQKFYNLARSIDAARRVQNMLIGLRQAPPGSKP